jgi:outer membrane protein assembly factor BamD (BamD/ComL family)
MAIEDYSDEDIAEEYIWRALDQESELIREALEAIQQGRYLDAQTALERILYPKFYSSHEAKQQYLLAMGRPAEAA